MAYKALRVFKADGRRYVPGDICEGAESWPNIGTLLDHAYVAGYPDEPVPDPELDALRAEAKALGIKGYGNMKKDTLSDRIAEIKALQNEQNPPGGDGNVDVLGGSDQQPQGQAEV
ncbi:hypothetical protein AAC03nite_20200 [Alicyclobacillus acidoterrestris]|nr:hypothetical protein AAC03nite_20200 [Alicyclobacillus acidoterrestris]